jgi:hypothetical protein
MPSDIKSSAGAGELALKALAALEPRVDAFHTAVATAEEEIRTFVNHGRGVSEYRTEQMLVELGPFALGRIDPEAFAALLPDTDVITSEGEDVLVHAERILADFAVDHDFHHVVVEAGGDLRDAVKEALEEVGRVFGASRAVELARSGLFDADQHGSYLSGLPFRKWNRAERQLAPPLVVEVEAEDLLPAGLGEFLDGLVKIVLVVRGPTTPAPLARLITPGTYILQTANVADLAAFARSPNPGVALLFDEERPDQARFVHDPEAGGTSWQRLTVTHMPEQPDVGRGRRAPTWLEEFNHLQALAKAPPLAAAAGNGAEAPEPGDQATPADQLAAYLLSQVELEG